MSEVKLVKGSKWNIKVVEKELADQYISSNDAAMDRRAKEAVKAAISKAQVCHKPIAKYDAQSKQAYLQYPDGRRVDVR